MKNIKSVMFALVATVLLFNVASAQFNEKDGYTALYRLYNSQTSDHLYTTSCDEKDTAIRDAGYVYEGVAGYVATRQMRRTVPLYRLLLENGEHFYTTDYKEMTDLTRGYGNKSEGIVGYLSSSGQRNTAPFYRLLNGDRHLYTADEREKNKLLRDSGSRLENTSGYVWTSGANDCGSNSTDDYPVIYAKTDFTGRSETLESDWNVSDDWDGSPNTIRAIRVPQGWYVTIYERKNFRGKSFLMSNDAVFTNNNEWYNRIGSIKISKGKPPR